LPPSTSRAKAKLIEEFSALYIDALMNSQFNLDTKFKEYRSFVEEQVQQRGSPGQPGLDMMWTTSALEALTLIQIHETLMRLKRSSKRLEKLSRALIGLTIVLITLTLALIWLNIVG
jgi:hypothetical protein